MPSKLIPQERNHVLPAFELTDGVPKYFQIQKALESCIRQGSFRPGDRLCTEEEIKRHYSVSTPTAVRALNELERQGLVTRRRGAGTFVRALKPDRRVVSDPGFSLIVIGVHSVAHPDRKALNWFVIYETQRAIAAHFHGTYHVLEPKDVLPMLALEAGEHGLILMTRDAEIIAHAGRRGLAHILLNDFMDPPEPVNAVNVNHIPGVYEAMTYLIQELGHRDIALITGASPYHRARAAGYRIGLETFGIPYRKTLVAAAGQGTEEGGREAMARLLAGPVRFRAVFVDTDIKAQGALAAARAAGLRVPEDLSVIGFDDIPGAERMDPPLTTVRVPHFEMAAEAVRLLRWRRAHGLADVPAVNMETRLVRRASCAVCRT